MLVSIGKMKLGSNGRETPAMEDINKLLDAVQEFQLELILRAYYLVRHPGSKAAFIMDGLFLQLPRHLLFISYGIYLLRKSTFIFHFYFFKKNRRRP